MLATGIGSDGALAVALPLTDVDNALSSQLLLLALIAAGGIALAALLGMLVARTALAPIARFTRQTEVDRGASRAARARAARGRTDDDELARLARTFNTTLDALDESVQAQRNLVADASHELRTPIASIRANLQLLRDEALLSQEDREALRADMIEELDELTALVGDVVELARGGKAKRRAGGRAARRDRGRCRRAGTAPGTGADRAGELEPTLVHGDGERIARAVSNLLDNACKWSPPGGLIEVGLHDGTVTVRDHGPGFHEEDLPFVFDRFHRAKDARTSRARGSGWRSCARRPRRMAVVEAGNAPAEGRCCEISFGPVLEIDEAANQVTAAVTVTVICVTRLPERIRSNDAPGLEITAPPFTLTR